MFVQSGDQQLLEEVAVSCGIAFLPTLSTLVGFAEDIFNRYVFADILSLCM
jgi:hypothetical protein